MSSPFGFDAFAKPVDGLRNRTMIGGIITLLAATSATVLFVSQLYLYAKVNIRHSLHLAESKSSSILEPFTPASPQVNMMISDPVSKEIQRIPFNVHITFPHIRCRDLDYSHDNASLSNGQFRKLYGPRAFTFRNPNMDELKAALGITEEYMTRSIRRSDACTIQGTIMVPRVGGSFTVTVSRRAWQEVAAYFAFGIREMTGEEGNKDDIDMPHMHNTSHYIHDISFGETFPLAPNPLHDASHIIKNTYGGSALTNIAVKLIPTKYKRFARKPRDTYQLSVAEHVVMPNVLAAQQIPLLPGIALTYDFTPLAVHHVESREHPAVFLSSLVSIVGGVFVTVGLITGCLINSAAAVAKKMD